MTPVVRGYRDESARHAARPHPRRPESGLRAEEADREFGLGEAARAVRHDPVGVSVRAVGDHLGERVVDVVRADPVVAGDAAGKGAVGDESLVERPAQIAFACVT